MGTKNSQALRLIAMMMLAGTFLCCAKGLDEPESTPMAIIDTELPFSFGQEELCVPINQVNTLNCSDSTDEFPNYYPSVRLQLEPFLFDQHEVTNDQYNYCVAHGHCTRASDDACNALEGLQGDADYCDNRQFKDYPVVSVTWDQASEYCAWVGKRLPTEWEWERVAKGHPDEHPEGRTFPADIVKSFTDCTATGAEDRFAAKACSGDQLLHPVNADEEWDSVMEQGQEIRHLLGNVAEWTANGFDESLTCLKNEQGAIVQPCASDTFAAFQNNCPECNDYVQENEEAPEAVEPGLDCFYMCADEDRSTILCERLGPVDTVFTPADLNTAGGEERVVRGASANITQSLSCRMWSRFRTGEAKNKRLSHVGFRCACSDVNPRDGECDAL